MRRILGSKVFGGVGQGLWGLAGLPEPQCTSLGAVCLWVAGMFLSINAVSGPRAYRELDLRNVFGECFCILIHCNS